MALKSALRRLVVTLPFFALAAVLLGFFGETKLTPRADPKGSPLVLIVTTSSLRPAFEALQSWSDEQGTPTLMLALDPEPGRRSQRWMAQLGPICTRKGVTGVLLGGNQRLIPGTDSRQFVEPRRGLSLPDGHRLIPVPTPSDGPIPEGLRVGRAVVDDLPQAWAFVRACRGSGRTLPQLLDQTRTLADRDAEMRAMLVAKALSPRRP